MACGILVPQRGLKPVFPAVEVQSLNHWTSREVPEVCFSLVTIIISGALNSSKTISFRSVVVSYQRKGEIL